MRKSMDWGRRERFAAATAWLAVIAALVSTLISTLVSTSPLHAQESADEREGRPGQPSDAPLEVTIRPRYEELKDGFVEDAIIETSDGHFMLYTGRYMQDPGDKFRLPGSDRVDLSGLLLDLDEIAFGDRAARPDPRRYGLGRDGVGLQLGRQYQGMGFDEISLSFGRDPYGDVKGYGSRGFYQSRNLWEPYDLADQVLGDVNFSSSSGAPPPLRLGVILQKALELATEARRRNVEDD